jgi:uncharacterized protein (DUF58 family)
VPTRRGTFFACAAAALLVAGRLLGVPELYALAAGAVAVVIAAVVYVRVARVELETKRALHPARVHAGTESRVDLAVTNRSGKRSPVLSVRDPFDGGRRWARFLMAPLLPGETARAAYRLPTEDRGVFDLGPMQISLTDPFGLASTVSVGASPTKLTVYPRIDAIEALPDTLGHDPYAGAEHPTALGRGGEDFYALRAYEVGDDLRRVHWPASAKADDLIIRQDEMPWQGRSTVVCDLRRGVHNRESLEVALSATASIVTACWRRQALIRLVTTQGLDSGFGAGQAHGELLLEQLASAAMSTGGNLALSLATLHREGNGGAVAVVTTEVASDTDLEAVARLRGRFGSVVLVLLERGSYDRAPAATAATSAPRRQVPRTTAVRVSTPRGFATAWNDVIGSHRAGAVR